MARYIVFSVRDRAADTFGRPFLQVNKGSAIRAFTDEVNTKPDAGRSNPLNQHPDDFDLYELGEFDDSLGLFDTHEPRMVIAGKECVKS